MPRLILLLTLLASGALIAQEHDSNEIPSIEEIHRQLLDVLLELEYLKLDHFKYDEATNNLAWELATDVETHRQLSGADEYDRVRELRQERLENIFDARAALETDQQEQTNPTLTTRRFGACNLLIFCSRRRKVGTTTAPRGIVASTII